MITKGFNHRFVSTSWPATPAPSINFTFAYDLHLPEQADRTHKLRVDRIIYSQRHFSLHDFQDIVRCVLGVATFL